MSNKTKKLADAFLGHVCNGHGPVTVFLTNGVKLSGSITWFDNESITLSRDGLTQLIMRHAVSTVMPEEPFQVFEIMDGSQAE